ncbi:MAG: efflux RND transporter periplasmic adaptor subunit [Bryobacteraceae bacterium]|nr:efflux RND transporter periplasmic adaptor subunit [Bryobacteraceae bacterium]
MRTDLQQLRIDKSKKSSGGPPKWAVRWILAGIALLLLLGAGNLAYQRLNAAVEVQVARVAPAQSSAASAGRRVILNATGYIIAARKIELASKVVGRVAWIGVEKGDKIAKGQPIVRLEDDEYRAQLQQARGNLATLQARLLELENGSRPEEIAVARANLEQAKADLEKERLNLERTRSLAQEGVFSKQALDDALAQYDAQAARVRSLERTWDLVRIGPRPEQIEAARGQVEEAKGRIAFFENQLSNTIIRAPVTGTILEREVEVGEYVTTSFVGERGAKGYVVSMADLNHLQVELDINQNDFAKLARDQRGIVTTDAYPDREYEAVIEEISPEANRQKATVQVKVRILQPDDHLRPEMNASVAFYTEEQGAAGGAQARPVIHIPASAVRSNAVFLVLNGRAVRREVKTGGATAQGLRIEEGLYGGEDLILNPPADLKDNDKIRVKQG